MENNDNNYLFELIQSIQSKLSEEKPSNSKEEKINTDYIQETMFKNEQKKESKKDSSNFNLSDVLNNFNLSGLLGNNDSGFDINNIMKIQKILSAMGRDDPRKNLLISLKPFLRKSRQEKINEYLTYLTIGNALGIFDDKGSDTDVT
ncbi:MAG: hypothetical protein PHD15_00910 [Clostridia bacterium]|nr:hypothetical protein [Clostridia bacterium]MDD4386311.1 hypothetical protein [Clostridia bacterium]